LPKFALMPLPLSQEYWPSTPITKFGATCKSAPACTPPRARVVVVAGNEAVEGVVVAEGSAEVSADIEAGPVVVGTAIGSGLRVGTCRHVGGQCRRAEGDERDGSEKKFLHFVFGLQEND
jgi:hypothetical protein